MKRIYFLFGMLLICQLSSAKDLFVERATLDDGRQYTSTVTESVATPMSIYCLTSDQLTIQCKQALASAFMNANNTIADKFMDALQWTQRCGISSCVLVGVDKKNKRLHYGWYGDVYVVLEESKRIIPLINSMYSNNSQYDFTVLGEENTFVVMSSPGFLRNGIADDTIKNIVEDYFDENVYRFAQNLRDSMGVSFPITVLRFGWVDVPMQQLPNVQPAAMSLAPSAPLSHLSPDVFLIGSGVVAVGALFFGWLLGPDKDTAQVLQDQDGEHTKLTLSMRVKRWWNSLSNAQKYIYGFGSIAASAAVMRGVYVHMR